MDLSTMISVLISVDFGVSAENVDFWHQRVAATTMEASAPPLMPSYQRVSLHPMGYYRQGPSL
jgi:hypothetical protein